MNIRKELCFKIIAGAVFLTLLSSCASMGTKADYRIETVPSENAIVSKVYVREADGDINISGEVRRRHFPARRSIPGHVDVEISKPDGTLLTKNNIHYHRMSRKSVKAKFATQFSAVPVQGSAIRVTHHYEQHH